MSKTSKTFMWHFSLLMLTVFTLFFLTVGMGKASAELIIYMNDNSISKPAWQWAVFLIGAPISTAVWCIFWLLFKKSEKHCIELMGSK
jgi:uncharacterized BrkB/YihY/UPF0761 family membrane protein